MRERENHTFGVFLFETIGIIFISSFSILLHIIAYLFSVSSTFCVVISPDIGVTAIEDLSLSSANLLSFALLAERLTNENNNDEHNLNDKDKNNTKNSIIMIIIMVTL